MVAITTSPAIPQRRHVTPAGYAPSRLRLVAPHPTGSGRRTHLAVVVLGLLVVIAAALFLARSEPVPAAGHVPLLDRTHTVAEGETMWSIANQVAPAGEAATYVERLVAANGSARVTSGQVLALPVP